ncbi:hypothetical protein OF117_15770 [Geodermatophilus sp. YIM 151500]|uniref:hypothetical protein n=1 Tax=Geodermatophilus sp. YIM 151500 TaxID=2984531 RepID=UPI0021E45FBF|nr:hypothetical protein [Geodermatophilus sp. YIM 151500]MCV2490814.1 hypothetical protein [Geodermatophilus sp. YIM 151500]
MQLYRDEVEVQTRLQSLGLDLLGLRRVVASGAGGWNSTTAFHPSSARGSFLYFETTAALRRLVVPMGWEHDELDGQARTFNRGLGISIVVQSGDELTGQVGQEPRTRHPKGSATAKKIETNGQQLALFNVGQQEPFINSPFTWVLLVAVVDGEVRAELSLPSGMSADSRPCDLVERILIPSQPLGGPADLDVAHPVDGGPSTDVDVSWR